MQPNTEPNPTADTFASLLAALAGPGPKPEPELADELEEELASLSYESALKTHGLYNPSPDSVGMPPMPPAAPRVPQAAYAEPASPRVPAPVAPVRAAEPEPQAKLKTASITIRMSSEECAQLRHRAAEAGMSISAYLRSCTFEAETLRAQVKEVMAEMRAATAVAAAKVAALEARENEPMPVPASRRNWRNMVERLMPHQMQQAVRA